MSSLEDVLNYPLPEAMKIFAYDFCCPLVGHHTSGRYFRYWSDHNIARCFGGSCTRGSWNIIELIMHYQRLDFINALKLACEKLGIVFRGISQKIIRQPLWTETEMIPGEYRQIEYVKEEVPRPAGDWLNDRQRFIERLYFADEKLLIANRFYEHSDRAIPCESSLIVEQAGQIERLSLCNNKFGAWICTNPIKGQRETAEKISASTLSYFTKTHKGVGDVVRYSYLLVESDSMSLAEQYSWLKASRLPILTLTHSGGKSLHALVLIDARNETEYKEKSLRVYEILQESAFKADAGNCNPNRYTRLPGVSRDGQPQYLVETNGWQSFQTIDQWLDWMTVKKSKVNESLITAKDLWDKAGPMISTLKDLEMPLSLRIYDNQFCIPFVDCGSGEVCGVLLNSKSGHHTIIGRESYYPCLYAGLDCFDLHICCSLSVFETTINEYNEAIYYLAYEPECLEIWPVLKKAFERVFIHTSGDQDFINAAEYFKHINKNIEVIINE